MGMVIGIDVGGSTTKIIGVDGEGIKHPMIVKATDPITSLFGAFGKYIYDNNISLSGIEKVMLTGVGSAYVNQPLYGLPTEHTDEFLANGLGAHYGSQLTIQIIAKDTRHPPSGRNGTKRNSGKHRFTDKGYLQCCPAGTSIECYCIYFRKSRQ